MSSREMYSKMMLMAGLTVGMKAVRRRESRENGSKLWKQTGLSSKNGYCRPVNADHVAGLMTLAAIYLIGPACTVHGPR